MAEHSSSRRRRVLLATGDSFFVRIPVSSMGDLQEICSGWARGAPGKRQAPKRLTNGIKRTVRVRDKPPGQPLEGFVLGLCWVIVPGVCCCCVVVTQETPIMTNILVLRKLPLARAKFGGRWKERTSLV